MNSENYFTPERGCGSREEKEERRGGEERREKRRRRGRDEKEAKAKAKGRRKSIRGCSNTGVAAD